MLVDNDDGKTVGKWAAAKDITVSGYVRIDV